MEYQSNEIVSVRFRMSGEDAIELLKYCELTNIDVYYESFNMQAAVVAIKANNAEITFLKLLFNTNRW